ncbi:class D beta-lactamase [Devosia chinhatensis]|uniref:beta-lactamase n=1 Tax=Devosia chinhatensis TaxID=429727 RepID=A0A0F5FGW6_9HYPH|nr:class D beta-lactamase [Devosia chinhatensis]KKB08129.1 beta-lactamase [Devosia chinhatensis]
MLDHLRAGLVGFGLILLAILPAHARPLCTLLADAESRAILLSEGDCDSRVTPASTFKLPLAVMAFDAGIITSPSAPRLSFTPGDPDWNPSWRQDTDPEMWMKNSTLWYSQRLAEALGQERLSAYALSFGYGNGDFSGDPGRNNGLERAWVSSSLQISPVEQASFMTALLQGQLPVARQAAEGALGLLETAGHVDGWQIRGKTGSAYPRRADGSFDYASGWGWYLGWAEKNGRRLVVVRLNQDEARHQTSGGLRARDEILEHWTAVIARAGL